MQVVKFYTRKIFKLFQKEWAVVMTLFFKELENEGSRITYLASDFSEFKDKWDKISHEICGELHVMCSLCLT